MFIEIGCHIEAANCHHIEAVTYRHTGSNVTPYPPNSKIIASIIYVISSMGDAI